MTKQKMCDCCGNELRHTWTDTHGVGACIVCGLPYRIYHYDGSKRVDRPPECALSDEGVQLAKQYWEERKMRVFPGEFDMGFCGHEGRTYSGATAAEVRNFHAWLNEQEAKEAQAS